MQSKFPHHHFLFSTICLFIELLLYLFDQAWCSLRWQENSEEKRGGGEEEERRGVSIRGPLPQHHLWTLLVPHHHFNSRIQV